MSDEVIAIIEKVVDSEISIGFNWTPWLKGASIATSTWSTLPGGGPSLGAGPNAPTDNGKRTTAWAMGDAGTPGEIYYFENEVTSDETPPRKDTRTLGIKVVARRGTC